MNAHIGPDGSRCFWQLADLSDDQLTANLGALLSSCRSGVARLVAHLAEVEERRLHLRVACSSMFSYCTARLGMSEDEACRRIEAARLARKFPLAYRLLEDGSLSLTVLCLLKEHATECNHAELLAGLCGKSVRDAREWLAARFPRPDVPESIRRLPARASATTAVDRLTSASGGPKCVEVARAALSADSTGPRMVGDVLELGRDSLEADPEAPLLTASALPTDTTFTIGDVAGAAAAPAASRPEPRRVGSVTPLSAERFKVQFTASRALRDKLELARDLMSHALRGADVAEVVERAVDLLVEDLMKRRFGKTARPRAPRPAAAGRVVQATKRAVVERDGLGCTWTDERGRRCGARAWLELDHQHARARGGGSGQDNIRVLCGPHNQLMAEQEFGRDHVERAISRRRRHTLGATTPAGTEAPAPARVVSPGCRGGRGRVCAGGDRGRSGS